MRVSSVSVAYMQQQNLANRKNARVPKYSEIPASQSEIAFGRLKFGDYIAGGICGTVMTIVATAALGPFAGGLIGAFTAKATAEANNESRPPEEM